MKFALVCLLIFAGTAWANNAIPTPQPADQRAPTMPMYNGLKAHVRALDAQLAQVIACIGTGIPVFFYQRDDDGVTYLAFPPEDRPFPEGTSYLVATTCVA